ncbi:thiol:disulfide interchange protein DsbG [Marinobacter guineae]|uniref:Thiol:disulfide interchange protein n=1 Tax=Marinobacter guineae TaxID=432303 RepID=A0A2G1VEI8_9GAMM|nr:thiol:disulfide interchange protein DsbG [Marinobacter guineae]PHQ25060.1 thiol:disulfide interchange protein DsbG [Marinobacter guineae]
MSQLPLRRVLQSALLSTIVGAASVQAQDYPPAIQKLEQQGVEVIDSFKAPGGMTGYVGKMRGRSLAFYLTPDGDHVIVGTLMDKDGNNLSQASIQDLVMGPKFENAWPQLEDSHWVRDGDKNADITIYTFTDPNCPYCHRFRQQAEPWINAGKVQLRHIMVGILAEDSLTKAATILGSENPEAALAEHQNSYEQGGITVDRERVSAAHLEVKANNRLMQELGLQATPSTLYRDENGSVTMVQGLPNPQALKRMMGPRP